MDRRIIHAKVARSVSFATCNECTGENRRNAKITVANNDPTTLTIAPKRLDSSTSTATNKNGAAIFQGVLEKTKATVIAHTALTAIPSVDRKV